MWLRSLSFIVLFLSASLTANELNEVAYSSGITTFMLDNGIKVAMKYTDNEEDEVVVRLVAVGGFAELPQNERAAGQISADAAFRSGISNIGFDKMHTMLYEHSVEFETQMQPFSRSLELYADREELEQLFKMVNLFFTKSRFSHKAYDAHKRNLISSMKNRSSDSFAQFEAAYLDFNSQQYHVFNMLQPSDVEAAKFEHSEQFFKRSFVNPSDFICVIVGDFDADYTKKLVKSYLGSIPIRDDVVSPKIPRLPDFSKGVKAKVVKSSSRDQSITRMTFPLHVALTQDNARHFEVISSLIRERLVKKICHHTDPRPEVRVSLEFPYYPSFHNPWISIQYISEPKLVSSIGQSILVELKKMQAEGFLKEELDCVKEMTRSNESLSKMENYFWLTQIANYILWDWDLENIEKDYQTASYWNIDEVNRHTSKFITLDNYSIFSLQPLFIFIGHFRKVYT